MVDGLTFTLRTPHEVVFEGSVDAARVPTGTGQVGLRPRGEAFVSVVEPGLVLLRTGSVVSLAASAGGLIEFDGAHATLYSPAGAAGEEQHVREALERIRRTPDAELVLRQRIGELEQRIVKEVGGRPRAATLRKGKRFDARR